LEYKQQKRRINNPIRKELCTNTCQRDIARNLKISKDTVARRLRYLAKKARMEHRKFLETLRGTIEHIQFDDMVDKEHTKMKPLSITVVVCANRREILGVKVSKIPAFGSLSKKSIIKYGYRVNEHLQNAKELFASFSHCIAAGAVVRSDKHRSYPTLVKQYLPTAKHLRYKGRKAKSNGQGELKRGRKDPLFWINHTCGMFRSKVSRLNRDSWNLAKDPERLQDHLDIYINWFNQVYLAQ
jgi:hypothetical protein